MQLKKNPEVDARRNSLLYFQIGLFAITALTYFGIELKTQDPVIPEKKVELVENFIEDDEVIPMTQPVQKAPPPPPPAPEVIKVVDDKVVIEDKPIQTTETNQQDVVTAPVASSAVGEVSSDADEVDEVVPFKVLEDYPVFPGCEKVAKDQRLACFEEKMEKHIRKNFNYPESAKENGIKGRVIVVFEIGKDGKITNVRARGPKGTKVLEDDAMSIISKLPKMEPGKQRGKPARVSYQVPINYTIQE